VEVLNAVLRKLTIMRVDKEGREATEGILQCEPAPGPEEKETVLIKKEAIELLA
jgi:hypothetical protein